MYYVYILTNKINDLLKKGVKPSAVWKHLEAKAGQTLYFPKLKVAEELMSKFKQSFKMDNLKSKHDYSGLEDDVVKIGSSFVQTAKAFLEKIEQVKESGNKELIDLLEKMDKQGLIVFQKAEALDNNIVTTKYTIDSELLQKFRDLIK